MPLGPGTLTRWPCSPLPHLDKHSTVGIAVSGVRSLAGNPLPGGPSPGCHPWVGRSQLPPTWAHTSQSLPTSFISPNLQPSCGAEGGHQSLTTTAVCAVQA